MQEDYLWGLLRICLHRNGTKSVLFSSVVVPYVQTPLFLINSAYDSWQINNTLVPAYLDPQRTWDHCKVQITFGVEFLKTFEGLAPCFTRIYFITSCHTHGKIMWTSYWFNATSLVILDKTVGEAVGDWYFDRAGFHQHIDPYSFARDCQLYEVLAILFLLYLTALFLNL
ncbi:hypothetical protein K7X08_029139 [Anisodus acutangulus]|uniref:Pectin acetylesterase n=1 Tax=Anisodus acutangulus TaxID=402998 RepID=A0A9Q1L1R6_9SOLA|nr:hypothetical protein K7X08_029139 [Anisodus acutangulus]